MGPGNSIHVATVALRVLAELAGKSAFHRAVTQEVGTPTAMPPTRPRLGRAPRPDQDGPGGAPPFMPSDARP
jgi:hypothetical protein